jgi:hypothetical protein
MASNILRAIKASFLRHTRKFSKSHSCNTIASFYAGPEHLHEVDDVENVILDTMAVSNVPTIIVTSSSQGEAMFATPYFAEIEIPIDDDNGDEESHLSEYSSDYSSDALSTLSSVTSDDSFGEPEDVFACADDDAGHAPRELEDLYLNINSPVLNTMSESPLRIHNDALCCIKLPVVEAASAVPKRLRKLLELQNDSELAIPQTELKLVDDIDIEPNYHIEWLTDDARQEAQSRSRKIQRTARIRSLDLAKITPLKAHEHPEPQGRCKISVLQGQGRSSRLKSSWNMDHLEEERQQVLLERSWKEAEDILKDLQDLQDFFSSRV